MSAMVLWPNEAAAGKGELALLFQVVHPRLALPEQIRSATGNTLTKHEMPMSQSETLHLAQEFLGRMGSGAEATEIRQAVQREFGVGDSGRYRRPSLDRPKIR